MIDMNRQLTTITLSLLAIYTSTSGDDASGHTESINTEGCPKGLKGTVRAYQCHCYEFTNSKTYWDNDVCTANGGHLAKIESEDLDDYLVKEAKKILPEEKNGVWIGASRQDKDSPFYWTDGTKTEFSRWTDGEPDHLIFIDDFIYIDQDCVYLKESRLWRWATRQCGHTLPSICQYAQANCTLGNNDKGSNQTAFWVGIIVGSILGALLLILILSCIIMKCTSSCRKYRKRQSQRRSVKYYSRPPSTCTRQQSGEASCQLGAAESHENDLNEKLVRGAQADDDDDDSILNVKGSTLPTASSIAAEAAESKCLVVDMSTGRATVKRINGPAPTRADNASTRSLKSFKMDGHDRVSAGTPTSTQVSVDDNKPVNISADESLSLEEDKSAMMANLDNVDKPSSHPAKDIDYK